VHFVQISILQTRHFRVIIQTQRGDTNVQVKLQVQKTQNWASGTDKPSSDHINQKTSTNEFSAEGIQISSKEDVCVIL
jgi:hypothetical protein